MKDEDRSIIRHNQEISKFKNESDKTYFPDFKKNPFVEKYTKNK